MKQTTLKPDLWWRGLLIAGVAALGFYLGYLAYDYTAGLGSTQSEALQATAVQRTSVTSSITATGNVAPGRQMDLIAPTAGKLISVYVQSGDKVTAGQPLAKMDTTDPESKVAQAQATFDAQQAKLNQLLSEPLASDVAAALQTLAQAQAGLEKARNTLTSLTSGPTATDVATAQQGVTQAQANLIKAQNDLATLKAPPDPSNVATAQQAVTQAQASLIKVQNDLATLKAGPDPTVIASDRASVTKAQADLNDAQSRVLDDFLALPQQMAAALANLDSAYHDLQYWYEACTGGPLTLLEGEEAFGLTMCPTNLINDTNLDLYNEAKARYDDALAQLKRLEAVPGAPTASEIVAARNAVAVAQANLDVAQAKLNQDLQGPTPQEIASAEAAVTSAQAVLDAAQAKLNQAQQGAMPSEIANGEAAVQNAQAALNAAQAKLQQVLAGSTSQEIGNAQADVRSAEAGVASAQAKLDDTLKGAAATDIELQRAQVEQARLSLAQAQEDLDSATLKAPFDGIVASVGANAGDQVSSNVVIVSVLDPTGLHVDLTVGETDIGSLAVGQKAVITTDAISGVTFTGQVTQVGAQATVSQGVVTYPVKLAIDSGSSASSQQLKSGMTANVSLIVAQRDNVLAVPAKAIRSVGGSSVVDVLSNGKIEARPVRTGLAGTQGTEITEGLQEGDIVLQSTSTTTTTTTGGGFMPGVGIDIGGTTIIGGEGPR